MMKKRRPRRRGFIIFFGWRKIVSKRREEPVQTVCPACRQQSNLLAMQGRNWFTLFFIPVFPISGAQRFVKCANCQACFEADIEQLRRKVAVPDPRSWQPSIALYNTLRESPKDSALLNQLLEMYAGMREFEEALAAGRHFPEALHQSAQCLTTYGKVNLAAGKLRESLNYFELALAKNPRMADAHFYTAVALISSTPPDVQQAIASARQAQAMGHKDAAELIRQAEGMSNQETKPA